MIVKRKKDTHAVVQLCTPEAIEALAKRGYIGEERKHISFGSKKECDEMAALFNETFSHEEGVSFEVEEASE